MTTLRMPHCYPVVFRASLAHWRPNGTHHGKKSNPAVVALSLVRLGRYQPRPSGLRLWAYFRGGYAWHVDLYVKDDDR